MVSMGCTLEMFCVLQKARDPRTNAYLHSRNGLSVLRTNFDFQAIKLPDETIKPPLYPLLIYSCYPMSINLKHFPSMRGLGLCPKPKIPHCFLSRLPLPWILKKPTGIRPTAKRINDSLIPKWI